MDQKQRTSAVMTIVFLLIFSLACGVGVPFDLPVELTETETETEISRPLRLGQRQKNCKLSKTGFGLVHADNPREVKYIITINNPDKKYQLRNVTYEIVAVDEVGTELGTVND